MIDRNEILRHLDAGAEDYDFPTFENGYYYHGDQKLTIFRDDERWAILLEVLACHNHHDKGLYAITTMSSVFGNCLTGINDNDNYYNFASDNGIETFIIDKGSYVPYLNSKAQSIKIKDTIVPIIFDEEHYLAKNIEFQYEGKITTWEFMRGLIPEYSHLFWLTREETSDKIPIDLPIFIVLNNWHHPELLPDERPSDTETFQQLADVIATGDKSLYNTTEIENTHWSNWPGGGSC